MKFEVPSKVLKPEVRQDRTSSTIESVAADYPSKDLVGQSFSFCPGNKVYQVEDRLTSKGPFIITEEGNTRPLILKMSSVGISTPGMDLASVHSRGMAEVYSLSKAGRAGEFQSLDAHKAPVLPKLEGFKFVRFGGLKDDRKVRLARFAIVMEKIDGVPLYDWYESSKEVKNLSEKKVLLMLSDIMGAMRHIQGLGIWHSDYAPKNLLVVDPDSSGFGRPTVRVIDPDCAQMPFLSYVPAAGFARRQAKLWKETSGLVDINELEMKEFVSNTLLVFGEMMERTAGLEGRQFIRQIQWNCDSPRMSCDTISVCIQEIRDRLKNTLEGSNK